MRIRVCGGDVAASLVRSVLMASAAAFILVWVLDSLSSAVLVITSLCCGAAVFSLILDVCPDHQLPNFLASLSNPKLHSLDCDIRKNPLEPWKDVKVPVEIDQALTELYEHILREYIYPWYGQVSLDESFVQEVRIGLRHASSILLKRVGKLDLAKLITQKGIPLGLSHLDSFLKSSEYAEAFQTSITDSYFDFLGKDTHTAAHNREKEILHIQNATRRILPLVVPKRALRSGSATALLTDIVSGAVLQPLMDLLANPDTINLILEVAFDPEPSKTFPPHSGEMTEFLSSFVTSHSSVERPPSALHMDLSAILKSQQALFYFMQFLKEEDCINQLQFCLSIEEFNKRMMTPELTDSELRSLHAEALEIYNLYMKPNAASSVSVRKELVKEIAKILGGSYRNIEKLRKTTPLFKAYEEVYNNLERMCPEFYKSEQYFELLLGQRRSSQEGSKKRHSSEKRKSRLKKRLGQLTPTSSCGNLSAYFSTPSPPSSRLTTPPPSPTLTPGTRPMFLPLMPIITPPDPRRPQDPRIFMRSKSSPSGHKKKIVNYVEDVRAEVKAQIPRRATRREYAKEAIKNKFPKSPRSSRRSLPDSDTKASDKIGRGFDKLKQGVFGKTMEGVVDPLDTALDVSHYVNDEEKEDDMSSIGGEGFVDYLSSRDLNSWRAEIPRLSTSQDAHGKPCFVYVIEVNRGLMVGEEERADSRQPNWAIHRQFHEFYVLETKLTEFHGEFEDVQLPARPGKLLFGGGVGGGVGGGGSHGLDVMQSRRGAFEKYLAALLAKPSLKGSDILFTFLTSEGDFASSSTSPLLMSGLGLGKMMRSVPMKLSKERGQGLVPFISAFVTQTQPGPPKPRHDYVVGAKEFDITLERPIEHHPLFGNNVGLLSSQEQRTGHCSKFYRDYPTRKESGVFDTLIYLAINVFKVSKGKIQILLGLRILLRKSVDTLVEWAIATKLAEVLSVGRVAYIIQILEEALFSPDTSDRTDEEKEERRDLALKNFKDFLRPILEKAVGKEQYESGVETVFDALQNPVINKQLAMFLFDIALAELFPELPVEHDNEQLADYYT